MPSLFDQSFEVAAAPLFDQWFGTTVQLQRGGSTSASFTASWSAQEYQSFAEDLGIAVTIKKRVYRFLKTAVLISAVQVTPRVGDRIVDGTETMEILPVEGKPAVESDPGGYRWLVRTNRVV